MKSIKMPNVAFTKGLLFCLSVLDLFGVFPIFETGSHTATQASLQILGSSNSPALSLLSRWNYRNMPLRSAAISDSF